MNETAKTILPVVFSLKTLILSLTIGNFVIIWQASAIPCMGFMCPWYYPWSFTNAPTLLLLAACALCLSMKWSYLAAIGLSGFALVQGIAFNVRLYQDGLPFARWVEVWLADPSRHAQYVLASIIFMYAVICLRSAVIHARRLAHAGI